MDVLDSKLEKAADTLLPHGAQQVQRSRKRLGLSRRAKFWIITLAAVGSLGLHLGGEVVWHTAQSARTPSVSSAVATKKFDWYEVSVRSYRFLPPYMGARK